MIEFGWTVVMVMLGLVAFVGIILSVIATVRLIKAIIDWFKPL